MSIIDKFSMRRGGGLPKNATFRLTQEGEEKLTNYTGTAQARILAALQTQGTCDKDEVASASGLSKGTVEKQILALIQKGYVRRVGAGVQYSEEE